ncbi:NAD-dependent epimerase/dehydratase [Micromonospora sp. NPDC050980]|uniref:NAD-dependent epimerase/dehydratase family protein n=1 Tax=Micromonospora sp. NPDC050980 TaxID=3155161 RepID=UPI0033D75750
MSRQQPSAAPVLVLGGHGFLGRHACAALAAAGDEVIAVSRRPARLPAARSIALDLAASDQATISGMLTAMRPRVVVNAAGAVWGVSDEELTASNVTLVRRLVAALGELPWRPRLVHLGSVHEYGPVPAGTLIREQDPPRPVSPYGRTKLLGTEAVLAAVRSGAVDATVLRVVNVSGPGTPAKSLLGQVARQLRAHRHRWEPAVLRLAPLRAHRDFVDVRDIADAVCAAAAATDPAAVTNIGRGEAVSVRWLVDQLIAASGVPARIVEHGVPAERSDRGSGIDWQQVDITEARCRLRWAPRRGLTESLTALWAEVRAASSAEVGPVLERPPAP